MRASEYAQCECGGEFVVVFVWTDAVTEDSESVGFYSHHAASLRVGHAASLRVGVNACGNACGSAMGGVEYVSEVPMRQLCEIAFVLRVRLHAR